MEFVSRFRKDHNQESPITGEDNGKQVCVFRQSRPRVNTRKEAGAHASVSSGWRCTLNLTNGNDGTIGRSSACLSIGTVG